MFVKVLENFEQIRVIGKVVWLEDTNLITIITLKPCPQNAKFGHNSHSHMC
jgi:hypothetical protein